jgi:large subunit ribosomal protein L15
MTSKQMRLDNLKPQKNSKKPKQRIGRGVAAGKGASCGFGMRGQNSRSGTGTKPGFEGGQMPLYRRVPKLKHFPLVRKKKDSLRVKKKLIEVNLKKLKNLPADTEVDLEFLKANKIVKSKSNGDLKILGDGKIKVPLRIKASAFTYSAREKIELVGGRCIFEAEKRKQKNSFVEVTEKVIKYDLVQSSQKSSDSNIWERAYLTPNIKTSKILQANIVGNLNTNNTLNALKTTITMATKIVQTNYGYINYYCGNELMDYVDSPQTTLELVEFTNNNISKSFNEEKCKEVALFYLKEFFQKIDRKYLQVDRSIFNSYGFHHESTIKESFNKGATIKFSQSYFDIPIYASSSAVTIDNSNCLVSLSSRIGQPSGINVKPKLSEQDIITRVKQNPDFEDLLPDEAILNLNLYFNPKRKKWTLVYVYEEILDKRESKLDHDCGFSQLVDLILDANTGEEISILPRD